MYITETRRKDKTKFLHSDSFSAPPGALPGPDLRKEPNLLEDLAEEHIQLSFGFERRVVWQLTLSLLLH